MSTNVAKPPGVAIIGAAEPTAQGYSPGPRRSVSMRWGDNRVAPCNYASVIGQEPGKQETAASDARARATTLWRQPTTPSCSLCPSADPRDSGRAGHRRALPLYPLPARVAAGGGDPDGPPAHPVTRGTGDGPGPTALRQPPAP